MKKYLIFILGYFLFFQLSDLALAEEEDRIDDKKTAVIEKFGEDLDIVPFEIKQGYRLEKEKSWRGATAEEKILWLYKWREKEIEQEEEKDFFLDIKEERDTKKVEKNRERKLKKMEIERKRAEKEQARKLREHEEYLEKLERKQRIEKRKREREDRLRELKERQRNR